MADGGWGEMEGNISTTGPQSLKLSSVGWMRWQLEQEMRERGGLQGMGPRAKLLRWEGPCLYYIMQGGAATTHITSSINTTGKHRELSQSSNIA